MDILLVIVLVFIVGLIMNSWNTVKTPEHCKEPHKWVDRYNHLEEYEGMYCLKCGFKAGSQ